ncbi:MAG: tetratricopeptide repeat protein, partial [Planctomycetota bacterium]
PERRGAELAISAQLAQQRAHESLASWQALAALGLDEEKCFQSARRILAALRQAKDGDRARALLDECARRFQAPERRTALELEGLYLALDQRDLPGAARALERAKKSGGDPAPILAAAFHLGDAELAAGDSRAAEAHFQDATRAPHARSDDALYKLAFALLARGEIDGARRALAKFQAECKDSELAPEAGFLAGECDWRAGDVAGAAKKLAAVLPLAQGELRSRVLFRAGVAAGTLESWSECEAALSELARDFPEFPNLAEGELWRGRALLEQKKPRPARAAFERTLALDQGELAAGARLGLGRLLAGEGKLDDALSEYLKVALLYAHEESVSEALYRAGETLEALEDPAKAAARYREVLAEHARSPFAERARERLRVLEGR